MPTAIKRTELVVNIPVPGDRFFVPYFSPCGVGREKCKISSQMIDEAIHTVITSFSYPFFKSFMS